MTTPQPNLSPDAFVVRPRGNAPLPDLDEVATVRELKKSNGWVVTLLRASGDAFTNWEKLQGLLGDQFMAVPLLVDDGETPRYPTGMLSLRFAHEASDAQLKSLGKKFDLELVRRASFTKQQAMFKVAAEHPVYLPALSERIAKQEEVEDVWFEAESLFKRDP